MEDRDDNPADPGDLQELGEAGLDLNSYLRGQNRDTNLLLSLQELGQRLDGVTGGLKKLTPAAWQQFRREEATTVHRVELAMLALRELMALLDD
jgi:hypothetical protein